MHEHSAVWILALALALALAEPLASAAEEARTGDPGTPVTSSWRDPQSWRQLRIGMSRAEVLGILGEPGKVTTYYAFERWEYPDALGQRVNFDEKGRLAVWGAFAR